MKPLEREVTYLSPSSFLLFERNKIDYYKKKLAPEPWCQAPTLPMKAGKMVDAMLGLQWQQKPVPKEWAEAEEFEVARDLFLGYIACGGWQRLMNLGIAQVQEELWGVVPGTDIPIHGFADVTTVVGCIVDWKVTGANNPGKTPSPKPGYRYDAWIKPDGSMETKTHDRFGEPMHEIHEPWAVQLTFYNWIKHKEIRPYTSFIHLIAPGPRWTEYQAILPVDFQLDLKKRVIEAWELIQAGKVIPPNIPPDLLALL